MVNGWSTEEVIEFCTYYLDIDRIGVPVSRHEGRLGWGPEVQLVSNQFVLMTWLLLNRHILPFCNKHL
jgi:hypothetical protein